MAEKMNKGERVAKSAGIGAIGGSANAMLQGKSPSKALLAALIGAGFGGGAQAIGDAALGVPDDSGFLSEGARGAVGGGALGAILGPAAIGSSKGGGALLHHLMRSGMSKNKAMAILMGSSAAGGALGGAAAKGLDSGLIGGFGGFEK